MAGGVAEGKWWQEGPEETKDGPQAKDGDGQNLSIQPRNSKKFDIKNVFLTYFRDFFCVFSSNSANYCSNSLKKFV